MTSRRVLAVLAGLFLVLGALGMVDHLGKGPYALDTGAPVMTITFFVLGTASVAFLAYLKK